MPTKTGKAKPRTLYLPLNDVEITSLRNGEEVHKMYHVGSWKAMVVLHADGLQHPDEIERFEFIRRKGVHIVNAPIEKTDIDRFPEEAIDLEYERGAIRLLVMTETMLAEVKGG